MSTESCTNLIKAIVAVMAEVSSAPKTGYNEFHRFAYASEVDLITAVRPAMIKHGLALLPIACVATIGRHSDTSRGTIQWRTDLTMTYRLVHTSGESMPIQVPGSGVDSEDKGVYKALTGAFKYALRHTFTLPTGDDPDATAGGERPAPQEAPRRPQAAPRPEPGPQQPPASAPAPARQPASAEVPPCPTCNGPMWDNRPKKASGQFSDKGPDFKCKDKACGGARWPRREENPPAPEPHEDDHERQYDEPYSDEPF